jgi:tetratricopeptide (TPR) repeat protein
MTKQLITSRRCRLYALFFTAIGFYSGLTHPLLAGECSEPVAQAHSIQGQVEVLTYGEPAWLPVHQNMGFCPGDQLRVGVNSRAGLTLGSDTLLRLSENSNIRFGEPLRGDSAWLDLFKGIAHFISRVRQTLQVNTPYINASVEGTEFTVKSEKESAIVTVLEGRVHARNDYGDTVVEGGQQALASPETAPQVMRTVDPLDAVQWVLYYPPVVEPVVDAPSTDIRQSFEAYRRGDLTGAFSALDRVADVDQNPDLLVYRASLYLSVGDIPAARCDLDCALNIEPRQADALAMKSIIATVRNERQQALELARQAVDADPRASAPLLALSYARQARFQLEGALAAAKKATEVEPDNPLAWSRLAQMQLMFRQLNQASEAASRAAEISPDQPQTRTTLGFAQLLRLELDEAKKSFEQAIAHDQADPLPRLGLGLVEIRRGDLKSGRRQLEIAANMDPGNALIRSYLGKAYYEEKNNQQAATQFALAKQFDELDPTAWFYDAILKQSENRPVEALNELQTSSDLNDNRAVYRSRLLLDQDEAARNASQARIYQDLGFEQLARSEAYKSLQTNAQSHSAHRLLSDSYSEKPRHEKARLSELLQSQLLQPLSRTTIQPQITTSNLGILNGSGPSASGFSEYTPLFTRNGLDVQLNAISGSNGTIGDDLILSGLKDRISFSLSQFHYETDGWRKNNDLKQDIYVAFLQASLSPSTSIQLEYQHQETEHGDLAFRFDPDNLFPFERNDLDRQLGRIGVHHQFSPNSHLIASAIYQDLLDTRTEEDTWFFPEYPLIVDFYNEETIDSVSRLLELQYIQHLAGHSLTIGSGYYDEDFVSGYEVRDIYTFIMPTPPNLVEPGPDNQLTRNHIDPRYKNLYLYANLALPAQIDITLGAAYEEFESHLIEIDQWSPKFGLTWEPVENLILRTAYIESLARPMHMERSIAPTQVAGFNQLFDDVQGSEIKQYGVGFDTKLRNDLSIGAEFNRRDLQIPLNFGTYYEGGDEKYSTAYLYWTVTDRLAAHIAYEKEEYEVSLFPPYALTTQRTPIGFNYHWPSGMFLRAVGTYVHQEIVDYNSKGQENFWNVDAALGYRLPNRYGKLEFIAKNIFENKFHYYDLSFHSPDIQMPQFQPERQLFMRLTLDF